MLIRLRKRDITDTDITLFAQRSEVFFSGADFSVVQQILFIYFKGSDLPFNKAHEQFFLKFFWSFSLDHDIHFAAVSCHFLSFS